MDLKVNESKNENNRTSDLEKIKSVKIEKENEKSVLSFNLLNKTDINHDKDNNIINIKPNNIIDIREKEETNTKDNMNTKKGKKNINKEKQIINEEELRKNDEDKKDNKEKEDEKQKINENKENNKDKKKFYRREISIKDWGCKSIDQYNIIKDPVGEGTFGTVFKAYYKGPKDYAERMGIPEIVALKKIKTENEKQGFPITALREIMIMKRLRHKNILQLIEVVTSKQTDKNNLKRDAYLVFEYMEHDLCTLIYNKFCYEKSQIKLIMYQLLSGLKYLHDNNILHRDIKPANILINNKGVVKIGDFGLSRIFSEFAKNKRYTNRVVTRWYRAPELLLGDIAYGSAIDVWSIGCVFWEILTGEHLFRGNDEKEVFAQICKKCGTPSETSWPGISNLPDYEKIMPQNKSEFELDKKYKRFDKFDDVTFDLLKKMICLNPKERITVEDSLKHPYFISHEPKMCEEKDMPRIEEDYHHNSQFMKDQQRQPQHIARGEYNKNINKNFTGKKRNNK